MRFLALSGSIRKDSSNTSLLKSLAVIAPLGITVSVYESIGELPIFCTDLEGDETPKTVRAFITAIEESDGLIISSPEYVRTVPGGLKNAIDWLVSGEELIAKPIALAHASHRGDDMLATLRLVLSTVTTRFNPDLFLRIPLMKEPPSRVAEIMQGPANRQAAETFLRAFAAFCKEAVDE